MIIMLVLSFKHSKKILNLLVACRLLSLKGFKVYLYYVLLSCSLQMLNQQIPSFKKQLHSFSQEEELRKSGEAKYAHLSDELHVLIEVFAPPGEAYSRMSHALEEIKKFLVPVSGLQHSSVTVYGFAALNLCLL